MDTSKLAAHIVVTLVAVRNAIITLMKFLFVGLLLMITAACLAGMFIGLYMSIIYPIELLGGSGDIVDRLGIIMTAACAGFAGFIGLDVTIIAINAMFGFETDAVKSS